MKKGLVFLAILSLAVTANAGVTITGLIDGPRSGGIPKAIELYADGTVDLSEWSLKSANNGASSWSVTFDAMTGTATDEFIYVEYGNGMLPYFGFGSDYSSSVVNHNGDDTIGLFHDDVLVDIIGELGVDGTGEAWECLDSYLYRQDFTQPSTTWNAADWIVPGTNHLDPQGSSGANGDAGITVPFGTYQVPEPATMGLLVLGGIAALVRRRRA